MADRPSKRNNDTHHDSRQNGDAQTENRTTLDHDDPKRLNSPIKSLVMLINSPMTALNDK
jgi:hypothetical protein